MTTRLAAFALVSLAAACSYGFVPESLESAEVDSDHWADAESPSAVLGAFEADGEGRDFALSLVTETEEVEVFVHSPAETDFSAFDGLELSLTPVMSWSGGLTGMSLFEGEVLRYGMVGADGNPEVEAFFGADFATRGPEQYSSTEDGFDYTWHPIRFATDEGDVDVSPAEVAEIVVGGITWRVTAIAAYTETARPGTPVADCGGGGDLLSYEIERLDEVGEERERFQDRAPGMEMAARTCG